MVFQVRENRGLRKRTGRARGPAAQKSNTRTCQRLAAIRLFGDTESLSEETTSAAMISGSDEVFLACSFSIGTIQHNHARR